MDDDSRTVRGIRNPTATAHAVEKYLPLPEEERSGVALCLSGGGYRASLFDLGAMRRLNELGILSQVKTISAVSGGSIAAGFVAAHVLDGRWPALGEVVPGFEEGIAAPLRRLAGTNIRTAAALARLNPLNLRRPNAAIDILAGSYAEWITPRAVADLPERPRFVFCATDLTFRTQWVVDAGQQQIGSAAAGYQRPVPREWSIARAIAASSCFPGVFPPMVVDVAPALTGAGPDAALKPGQRVTELELTDGGVYDNLGIEPVWADHAVVLVSDASPSYGPSPDLGPLWPSIRPIVTLLEQATDVRKRWLIDNFLRGQLTGAYWGIASLPSRYDPPAGSVVYPDDLVAETLSQVRIELDAFSEGEQAVLENHGYLMCDLAIHKHQPDLVAIPAPGQPPYPDWLDPYRAAAAMRDSHRHKLLGRGRWR
jgi:NTE family protein